MGSTIQSNRSLYPMCVGALFVIELCIVLAPRTALAQSAPSATHKACAAKAAKIAPILNAEVDDQTAATKVPYFSLFRRTDEKGDYQMGLGCVYEGKRLDFDFLKNPDAPATPADRGLFIRAAVALGFSKEALDRLLSECERRRRASRQLSELIDGDHRTRLSCGSDGWALQFYPG